jgi:hypothetical protein
MLPVDLHHRRPTLRRRLFLARSLLTPALTLHSSLSHRHSTLLTRLRTGACDLGAYKAHFEPERLMCACGGEPETQEHFFLHCPLYTTPRATLLASLRLKSPSLAYLLSDPRTTKATLRFLVDSGRFDSLYSPPLDDLSS